MTQDNNNAFPILIIGPAYSGKSLYATDLMDPNEKTMVLGTSMVDDPYFIQQLNILKESRPNSWDQYDEAFNISDLLKKESLNYSQIIIDSINQWLGNMLIDSMQKRDAQQTIAVLNEEKQSLLDGLNIASKSDCRIILVSSEVSAGISPTRELDRLFRQQMGLFNQELAEMSKQVILKNAGIPSFIKP